MKDFSNFKDLAKQRLSEMGLKQSADASVVVKHAEQVLYAFFGEKLWNYVVFKSPEVLIKANDASAANTMFLRRVEVCEAINAELATPCVRFVRILGS